jgi:hypothetical protein
MTHFSKYGIIIIAIFCTLVNTNIQSQTAIQATGGGDCDGWDPNLYFKFFAPYAQPSHAFYISTNEVEKKGINITYNSSLGGWIMFSNYGAIVTRYLFKNTQNTYYPPATGWMAMDACPGATPPTLNLIVLPVKMTEFDAKTYQHHIALHWNTASEINNQGWEIQRSTGTDVTWQTIGWKDGNGTSHENNRYTYADANPLVGKNYYRLKQIDYDGKYEYSRTVMASYQSDEQSIAIYPNPSQDFIFITHRPDDMQYKIYNTVGQNVAVQKAESNVIDISMLEHGVYILHATVNGWVQKKSFVKI